MFDKNGGGVSMDTKVLKKLIDRYQQKADAAYRNYQESGVSRFCADGERRSDGEQ